MYFNELIRDNVPTILRKKGKTVHTHQASEDEYFNMLMKKLETEIDEFLANQSLEELADLIEIVYAIAESKKFKRHDLELTRNRKELEKGSFKKRTILDEIID